MAGLAGEAAVEQFADKFPISGSKTGRNEWGGGDCGNRSPGFAREGDVMFQFFGTDQLEGVYGARASGSTLIYHSFKNSNHVLSLGFTAVCPQISALLSTTEIEQESNILSKIVTQSLSYNNET